MEFTKVAYQQEDRRQYKQIIISFENSDFDKLTDSILKEVGLKIASYYSNEYQILMAAHFDKHNLHIHYIVNSVNVFTGMKFTSSPIDLYKFKQYVNQIVLYYNLSAVRMYQNSSE